MDEPIEHRHEGTRAFGELQVSWRGQPSPSGWEVYCSLQLGAATAQRVLDAASPRQPFELRDGAAIAWGQLSLRPSDDGRFLALDIDCHSGPASEQSVLLCAWKACDPCGKTVPAEGGKTLGEGGWIQAAWTIAGADQACLTARIRVILAGGGTGDTATLSPQSPAWSKTLRGADGHTELAFVLSVADSGDARIDAVVRHALLPGEHAVLDRFPIEPHPPGPTPEPAPGNGVVFGRPREFASFTYPRGLLPPTPAQWSRRFVEIDNSTDFQNTLRTLAGQKNPDGMIAEAQDFIAQPSKKYPGQYVRRIADLAGPMGRLEGPPARALLAMRPESTEQLRAAVAALLGVPIATFLALPGYPTQLAQLQDSLIALLLAGAALGDHEGALIQALQACHVAELLEHAPDLLLTPETLREPLEASTLLPTPILPPPAPAGAAPKGYAKPLGFADLQVIKQRLLRYRLGEIAHVENVMRGESKERSEQHRRRVETRERDTAENTDAEAREQDYQGRSRADQESVTNPLNTLKREFDTLKQEYGSDGLSVTVTGSWTDTPSGPATLDQNAAAHARRLLDRASAQLARRVESERSRRSVEEFVEQNRRRFDNEEGDGHLTGIYRWIDEIHLAHLEHRGSRLIVEIVVAEPAADYVRRNNVLHGIDATAPIPPWQGGDGIAPVHSAADINRDNYAALAARYNAAAVPMPPPRGLTLSAALASEPPRAQVRLEIPDGYGATGGAVSYGWTGAAPAGVTQALDVLVGETAVKIDPVQDPNPGSKALSALQPGTGPVPVTVVAAGLDYAVNVTLACACSPTADAYLRWQMAAYDGVMAAYRARRDDYFRAMARLAEGPARSAPERRRETERAELQKAAIQCLMAPLLDRPPPDPAPPAWHRDAAVLSLIPFFRDALDWGEMTYALYGRYFDSGDPDRPDWLTLAQTTDGAPGFLEFLEAGGARLLVPVKPPQALPLLFYLASGGRFWNGAAELAPVHEADWSLVNELKSLAHAPPPAGPGETWEVEVATSMLMLQPDARLPDPADGTEAQP